LEKIHDSKIRKEIVYKKYKEFCYKNKITPKPEYKFSQELTRMGFEYRQLRDGVQRQYYWRNLKWKV
jgi:hypothetical protein